MEKDYIIFWYDGNDMHTSVKRLSLPPHERLRGDALANMLKNALDEEHRASAFTELEINGVVELPDATWSLGKWLEVIDGNGNAAVLECSNCQWRVLQ